MRNPVTPRMPRCECIGAPVRGALLPPIPHVGNQAAAGRIGVRHPHPERLHAIGERRREGIPPIDELERRNLAVGEAGGSGGVGRIRIDVVRAALRGPGMPARRALRHVEDRPARHVVVHDAVHESVEAVALPHELSANRVHLRPRHPVGRRLFLNANQLRREHERRKVHDRHVRDDAVVVGRVALRHRQRLAPAL